MNDEPRRNDPDAAHSAKMAEVQRWEDECRIRKYENARWSFLWWMLLIWVVGAVIYCVVDTAKRQEALNKRDAESREMVAIIAALKESTEELRAKQREIPHATRTSSHLSHHHTIHPPVPRIEPPAPRFPPITPDDPDLTRHSQTMPDLSATDRVILAAIVNSNRAAGRLLGVTQARREYSGK